MRKIDLDKFRLRRFVERLIDMGEMEVRDEPVPLTRLSEIIESTRKGVLFRQAGPEKLEIAAKVAGGRARIAAAFDTTLDKLHDVYHRRLATTQETVQIPSADAPAHQIIRRGDKVDLTKLPFHPQHELDGSFVRSTSSPVRTIWWTGASAEGISTVSCGVARRR